MDPRFLQAAYQLGVLLAQERFELVYGGGARGCMGSLADGALSASAQVWGVAPKFLRSVENRHQRLTHFEFVPSLAARKLRMLELSDAVIVLPGGTGTLDEFLEVLTMKRLGLVNHPLIVVNLEGFFCPLTHLLQHLIEAGFAGSEQLALCHWVDSPVAALQYLRDVFSR